MFTGLELLEQEEFLVEDHELALKALTVLEMMSVLVTPALASPARIQASRGARLHTWM